MKEEDILQAKCHAWMWNTYPQTRRLFFHVPNEMERLRGETEQNHIRRIATMKAKGMVKGAHDNMFLWRGKMHTIELKVGRNTLSEDQEKFKERWTEHGARCFECRSFEQFQSIIKSIIE